MPEEISPGEGNAECQNGHQNGPMDITTEAERPKKSFTEEAKRRKRE